MLKERFEPVNVKKQLNTQLKQAIITNTANKRKTYIGKLMVKLVEILAYTNYHKAPRQTPIRKNAKITAVI